jgi:hypothetical protein
MALYREQYDRMYRWYKRFSNLKNGRPHDFESENYIDEIYAFFVNAYHVKDWIKNDHELQKSVRDVVEQYINDTKALALCADISISIKHLERTQSDRSEQNPALGVKRFGVKIVTGGPTTISLVAYEVKTDSGVVDAFDLATDCVNAWDAFFKIHKL